MVGIRAGGGAAGRARRWRRGAHAGQVDLGRDAEAGRLVADQVEFQPGDARAEVAGGQAEELEAGAAVGGAAQHPALAVIDGDRGAAGGVEVAAIEADGGHVAVEMDGDRAVPGRRAAEAGAGAGGRAAVGHDPGLRRVHVQAQRRAGRAAEAAGARRAGRAFGGGAM